MLAALISLTLMPPLLTRCISAATGLRQPLAQRFPARADTLLLFVTLSVVRSQTKLQKQKMKSFFF